MATMTRNCGAAAIEALAVAATLDGCATGGSTAAPSPVEFELMVTDQHVAARRIVR